MPVMLGGAALTRRYVEEDCVEAYGCGRVAYARDAFDGLALMDKVVTGSFDDHLAALQAQSARPSRQREAQARPRRRCRAAAPGRCRGDPPAPRRADARRRRCRSRRSGARASSSACRSRRWCPISTSACSINSSGASARTGARSTSSWRWAQQELRPVLQRMLDVVDRSRTSCGRRRPTAIGRRPARATTSSCSARTAQRELARFALPRQNKDGGLCIADFFRDVGDTERDVIGLQVVTMGRAPRKWRANGSSENRYQDYLYLHGLSVEMAEAMAEYIHKRIRAELGFAARGGARHRGAAAAGLSRQPLFLRLSRLSQPRRPAPAAGAARCRGDRRRALRRGPARPRAIDLGHRRHPPAGEVFLGLARSFQAHLAPP